MSQPGDEQGRPDQQRGRPDYKVYKSRPGVLSRLRSTDLDTLRERLRGRGRSAPKAPSQGRRWLRWIAIAIGVWILVSFLAFAISAQIQRFKLESGATKELSGNPLLLPSPQTILLLGSDRRDEETADPTFDPNAPSR